MKTRRNLIQICLLCAAMLQAHTSGAQPAFALSSTPGVGKDPASVAAADVNGDGKMDLISANNSYPGSLTVLTNDGSGALVSNASYSTPAYPAVVFAVDLNGQGKMALICAGYYPANGWLMVLTNNGSGNFVAAGTNRIGGQQQVWIVPADVNGDGKIDLICPGTDNKIMILTNAGNGTLAVAPAPPSAISSWSVVAADVNGDGKPDLIEMPGSYYMRVLTNNGDGTFTLSSTNYANTSFTSFISAADVNGDGWVDVIIPDFGSGSGKTLLVLTNNGHGYFGSNAVYTVGSGPINVAAADVNGDGMVDLICAMDIGKLTILTNNGSGFGSNLTLNVASAFYFDKSVVAADVNGDGQLDLITANNNTPGTLSIWTNSLTSQPKLAVKLLSDSVVVSWPSQWTGWAGWTLQQNADLTTTNWTNFDGAIGDDGITKTITNSLSPENLFFRLSHP